MTDYNLGDHVATLIGPGTIIATDGDDQYVVQQNDGRRYWASSCAFEPAPGPSKETLTAEGQVADFLNANHPCGCGDPHCEGWDLEASLIVEMVRATFGS